MATARQLARAVLEGESAREWLRRHKPSLNGWELRHVSTEGGRPYAWHFRKVDKLFTMLDAGNRIYAGRVFDPVNSVWVSLCSAGACYWSAADLVSAKNKAAKLADAYYAQFENPR